MNYFKRAVASIVRRPGKSTILLLLIFILGSVISGALAVDGAVRNTDKNLRKNMRPLATINKDYQKEEEWLQEQGIDPYQRDFDINELSDEQKKNYKTVMNEALALKIGELPQIEWFTYSLRFTLSDVPNFKIATVAGEDEGDGRTPTMGLPHSLEVIGNSEKQPLPIKEGVFKITAGRGEFTESELSTKQDVIPVIMYERTASLNHFVVGQTFTLTQQLAFEQEGGRYDPDWAQDPNNIYKSRELNFEIVGLYDIDIPDDFDPNNPKTDFTEVMRYNNAMRQLHIPNVYVEDMATFADYMEMLTYMRDNNMFSEHSYYLQETNGKTEIDRMIERQNMYKSEEGEDNFSVQTFYLLKDPDDIDEFTEAAAQMLPPSMEIKFRDSGFSAIETSMGSLQNIAFWILMIAIGATLLILSLLITLFLRDRRHEMGVYLAIGERKGRIVNQILMEVVVVALVSITLAVFTGHFISEHVSMTMIRNELTAPKPEEPMGGFVGGWDPFKDMGVDTGEKSPDEMLAAFEISLNAKTIGFFYVVGLGTVIVSAVVPVIYVVTLNPKKVLM